MKPFFLFLIYLIEQIVGVIVDFFSPRMIKWYLFGALISLYPLLFRFLVLILDPDSELTHLELTARGEVFLISAGMTAAAIGELIISDSPRMRIKILTMFSALLISVTSAFLFAHVSANFTALNQSLIFNLSLAIYVFSVLNGTMCIYLSEGNSL